jgi:hypothetical protein
VAANNRESLTLYLPNYHFVFSPDYHTPAETLIELSNSTSVWQPGEKHYGVCFQPGLIPDHAVTLGVYPTQKEYVEYLWQVQ